MATPEEVLDLYLFEDVYNNINHYEDDWQITFIGDNYILREWATDKVHNLKVTIGPGDLSQEEIQEELERQGWLEDEE